MNSHTSSTTGSPASLNSGASSAGSSGQNSSSSQAPPNNNMQPTPGSHITPSPVPHHRQVLQQLLQTLRLPSSPLQQDQILHILKTNPQLMAAFIKQRLQQQPQPHAQQRVLQQLQSNNPPAPPASLSQQQQTVNSGSSGAGLMNQNSAASQPAPIDLDMQVLLTLGNSTNMEPHYRRALHQLMEVLHLPSSPQQQDQIVEIIGSNPQLMEEFVKQKKLLQQQQQSRKQLPQQQQMVDPPSEQQQEQQLELNDILSDEWLDRLENFIESNRC